jgi:hypothetical protein
MDRRIRELERQAASGDPDAVRRLRHARFRVHGILAGDYVRLDGARVERLELVGNWRVVFVRYDDAATPVYVLCPVNANGSTALEARMVFAVGVTSPEPGRRDSYLAVAGDVLNGARVADDYPLKLAQPSTVVPCPRCGATPLSRCAAGRRTIRRRDQPHAARCEVPPLALPEPLRVTVSAPRERPSPYGFRLKVVASRNPNASLRLDRDDVRAAARAVTASEQPSIASIANEEGDGVGEWIIVP